MLDPHMPTPEELAANLSEEELHGHSRQDYVDFYRFCEKNWELTSVAGPDRNAWRDFWHYKNSGLLDTATGTILNEDGTPAGKGPCPIWML